MARVVVFEILKTNDRKAAQVVIFKESMKIFIALVDNFVRKWPALADDSRPRLRRVRAPLGTREKILTIFNELQHHTQSISGRLHFPSKAGPFCA
jgi:hypothetical protein